MWSPLYRFIREGKERRRHWAQKKTPRQSAKKVENGQEDVETGMDEESQAKKGMLPTNIVEMLASREKYDVSFSLYLCV